MLARELRAESLTHFGDVFAEDDRIGAREVNVFENASRLACRLELMHDAQAIGALHRHNFAGANLSNRFRADQIEGASLGRHDQRVVEPAENKWTKSVGIAGSVNTAGGEHRNRIRAAHARERIDQRAPSTWR